MKKKIFFFSKIVGYLINEVAFIKKQFFFSLRKKYELAEIDGSDDTV